MTDESMPPRPEVEFDFNLPHGIDADEDAIEDDRNIHDDPENANLTQDIRNSAEHDLDIDMHETRDGVRHSKDASKDFQNSGYQEMNYNTLEKGFSDDDDAPEAFDRSWLAHQARKSPPKKKKSPRADDDDDEASPRSKKPRQSLFGGPPDEVEENEYDDLFEERPADRLADQFDDLPATETTNQSVGNRMSSLNLEQQDTEGGPSEQPLNLGFGFGDSDRESMSPRESPAPSEGEIVIPPDTQVSVIEP
jgi:hypothetical protein